MSVAAPELLHLRPGSYNVIGPDRFGVPGLVARESVGPDAPVTTVGAIFAIHDSTFEPHSGIGHHPHQGMERLFYILEGAIDHDDALNRIKGRMRAGDLGILTEGRRGMLHSEWNHDEQPARCYILVCPTEPVPAAAAFDVLRDEDCVRTQPVPGATVKRVVGPETATRLHGDVRGFNDIDLQAGAMLTWELTDGEAGVVFVVDGLVELTLDGMGADEGGREHTFLFPPATGCRRVRITALEPSRVLQVDAGPGTPPREIPGG